MRGALAIIGRLAASQIAALPMTFVIIVALTPVLRRLETGTGLELAGHSGPADWVIFLIWAVISVFIAATLLVNRKQKESSGHDTTEV